MASLFQCCMSSPPDDETLHETVATGNASRVKMKLKQCDPQKINSKDVYRKSPLDIAAENNYIDIAQLLLDAGAKTRTKGWCGLSPLHWAVRGGYPDMVSMLIASGADVDGKSSHYKGAPLHLAVFNDVGGITFGPNMDPPHRSPGGANLAVIHTLVKAGANVNLTNNTGAAPLHVASFYGLEEATRLLLAEGADPNLKDASGQRPLDLARDPKVKELLAPITTVPRTPTPIDDSARASANPKAGSKGVEFAEFTTQISESRRQSTVPAVSLDPREPPSPHTPGAEPFTPGATMTVARRGELLDLEAEDTPKAESSPDTALSPRSQEKLKRLSSFAPGVIRRSSLTAMMSAAEAARATTNYIEGNYPARSNSFTGSPSGNFLSTPPPSSDQPAFNIANGLRSIRVHPDQ